MPRPNLLSVREGDDLVNVEEAQLPYVYKSILGQGKTSWVDEVEDELTNQVYARKRIPILAYLREERAKVFNNECNIIRGLDRHDHMIRVFATYVTSTDFCLILQPVASDRDLSKYLTKFRELPNAGSGAQADEVRLESMTAVLKRAFGCLTMGLAFMHDKKIRHKDVKPQNILIHEGGVLYTDFGYSFDHSAFTRGTTEGRPNALTKRYSSPELLMHEARNEKSDVFSLGCVLIEILAALVRDPVLDDSLSLGFGSAMLDDLHQYLAALQLDDVPHTVIETIIQMTQRNPSERICAARAAAAITQLPAFACQKCVATLVSP